MKILAFTTATVMALAPAIAAASQPTQAAPAQASTQTKDDSTTQESTATPKTTEQTATCDSSGKTATTDTKTSVPSPKVGKDTGDLPPPRKKPASNAACPSPPQ